MRSTRGSSLLSAALVGLLLLAVAWGQRTAFPGPEPIAPAPEAAGIPAHPSEQSGLLPSRPQFDDLNQMRQDTASTVASCAATHGGADPRLLEELLARAMAQGTVRVIVELRVVQGDLRGAQDAVLKTLEGMPHRVTRRYTAVPFLALEVGPEALRLLAASPWVLRIQEDRVLAPQGRSS